MKLKIALRSFEVSRFVPVIKQLQSCSSCQSCETCLQLCSRRATHRRAGGGKEVRYSVAALRRSWRALAQMPPLFAMAVPQA